MTLELDRIAILGMGRSGTTVLAELLGDAGVYLDDVNWAYEHEGARAVNDAYLAEKYGARPGLPYGRLPREEILVCDPAWRRKAAEFVDGMDERAGGLVWAFKDPRTTVLHDLWLEYFGAVVAVYRRADLVVESYMSQGWIKGVRPRRTALSYWERFNTSLVHVLDTWNGPSFLLEMSSDFLEQLQVVLERLGLQMPGGAADRFDPRRQPSRGADGAPRRALRLHRELDARRTVP